MSKRRRFERSMFVALLAVALVPTGLVVAVGTWALRDTLRRSGSAGPWATVAASGDSLADEVMRSWPDGAPVPESVTEAIASHREALAGSAEMSRLYAALSARALARLPLLAGLLAGLVALLAWAASRMLARGFARPVAELVDWTRRIAREESLPERTASGVQGIEELDALGSALRSLAREVDEGRERAVEAARLSTWTATARRVAHEIKNPLTPMKIAARQLRDTTTSPSDRQSADVLLEEIDRLDGLARTFAQVGSPPQGPPAPVDLVELCRSLADPHRDGSVSVTVQVEGRPPLIQGHLESLSSAIRNLLLNAVEACEHGRRDDGPDRGVRVLVRAVPGPSGAPGVAVTVEDDGIGLPAGLEDAVWNLDVTTKRRGSGIGLPLVRQTAVGHGGSVEARNRPEGGARFSLWIPVAATEVPTGAALKEERA